MLLQDIVKELDDLFCKQYAVEGDNIGLQVGKHDQQVNRVLIAVDVTDEVIQEACKAQAEMVFTHHPMIFSPVFNITSADNAGRKLIQLIKNNTAVYAAHTNFDLMPGGVNDLLALQAGLIEIKVLSYMQCGQWYKFVVFVPEGHEEIIRRVICESGGGKVGDYSCCTFNIKGTGTFFPVEGAKPYTGRVNELNFVDETRIECIVGEKRLTGLVDKVLKAHPYEEPAYDIYKIENKIGGCGIGRVGRLEKPAGFRSFLEVLKARLGLRNMQWMAPGEDKKGMDDMQIEKVAVINGSANSAVTLILDGDLSFDVLVTGELKYHNALSLAEKGIIVVEIGHGESEKIAIDGIYSILTERFKGLEIMKCKTGFKPWRYHIE